ncbi:hypothetical protein [Rubrivirga litoralis]|uniref:Outer membrane protein beta-barrel domain-containing protein n=1 Tax=Rubrivirga litoralis TaxID=3075598 RepID=A0ABU3BRG8_9BACT|nr:hypothetical protein [Rubrivirga sp. F394]MDT0631890.1 hypothetical protein [Rubrivirga sp. F394]
MLPAPLAALVLLVMLAPAAQAQVGPHRQSGPRVGVTYLAPGVVARINEATREGGTGDRIDPSFPVVTQFGWQFEFQTFQTASGATGVAEVVPLLSGLDRGLLLPSLTFVSGLRTRGGVEVGAGPNVSVSVHERPDRRGDQDVVGADVRLGLALVAGVNARLDGVSVPVNAAVVLGAGGARLSLLVGLNTSSARY